MQIYDSDFNDLFSHLKLECQYADVSLWGTEYYTYQGAQRCETHFGNSKRNIIRFRLNNDNSVSRILITTSPFLFSMESTQLVFSVILYVIFDEIGLSQSELTTLLDRLGDKLDRISSYDTHFHDKISVWCAKTRRYVTLDFEMDYSKVDFYLYADI